MPKFFLFLNKMFDSPAKKSTYKEEDSGNCGLKFGTMQGSPGVPPISVQTYDMSQQSNSVLLETTVERGYTSNRLSRIRSDRKQVSGRLRFSSEDSESDGMESGQVGALDIKVRTIRRVPVEQESSSRCCCFRLFSSSDPTSKKPKKNSKKLKNGLIDVDTTKDESTRLHDNLMGGSSFGKTQSLLADQ